MNQANPQKTPAKTEKAPSKNKTSKEQSTKLLSPKTGSVNKR